MGQLQVADKAAPTFALTVGSHSIDLTVDTISVDGALAYFDHISALAFASATFDEGPQFLRFAVGDSVTTIHRSSRELDAFEQTSNVLWRVVAPRLVADAIDAVASDRTVRMGDLRIERRGFGHLQMWPWTEFGGVRSKNDAFEVMCRTLDGLRPVTTLGIGDMNSALAPATLAHLAHRYAFLRPLSSAERASLPIGDRPCAKPVAVPKQSFLRRLRG